VVIKFIFLTEAVSFIPKSILNCCDIISFSKPTKSAYIKIIQNNTKNNTSSQRFIQHQLGDVSNISNIRLSEINCRKKEKEKENVDGDVIVNIDVKNDDDDLCITLQTPYKIICQPLCDYLSYPKTITITLVRNTLYDILIYNANIYDCVWMLLNHATSLVEKEPTKISTMLAKTMQFFQLYNNNYRPIYHMELFFFNLVDIIAKT
jgi:hypothetical protein